MSILYTGRLFYLLMWTLLYSSWRFRIGSRRHKFTFFLTNWLAPTKVMKWPSDEQWLTECLHSGGNPPSFYVTIVLMNTRRSITSYKTTNDILQSCCVHNMFIVYDTWCMYLDQKFCLKFSWNCLRFQVSFELRFERITEATPPLVKMKKPGKQDIPHFQ